MVVRIIVDDFGLYPTDDAEEVLTPEVNALHSVRERVRYRLASNTGEPLLLRMPSRIFRRFSDMEGQPGLKVERILPRKALRDRLGCPAPVWLDDRLAHALGLLDDDLPRPVGDSDVTTRVLSLIDPEFLTADSLRSFIQMLSRQEPAFKQLLAVPEVAHWLKTRLEQLGLANAAADELTQLLITKGPDKGYREVARAILRERLDGFIVRLDLSPDFALPPRVCSTGLVGQLNPLPIGERAATPYPNDLRELLSLAERRVASGELTADVLSGFVLQGWPTLFERFQFLFEQNPGIASASLVNALSDLGSEAAGELAKRLREYLDNAHCDPLPKDASVKDVLRWSERYFRYAIGALEGGDEPDERASTSFAHWVADERNRITQSDYDWRSVARRVDEDLASGKVVIVCMIDALGAIHNDLLELALREGLDPEMLQSFQPLFAPLPTITEIGKIAVLTGKEAKEQPANTERALRERFASHLGEPGALQIVRNWKDFRQALRPETRLLVCLDNRVDDDLHQCTDFHHHRERVRSVAKQLVRDISQWALDARRFGKKASILITADHGATKVSRSDQPLEGTTPTERRILFTDAAPHRRPEGFHFEQTERSGGGYLIPYGRVAYGATNTMLHGGLTPEEVLIPFVCISREKGQTSGAPRVLAMAEHCQPVTQGWHVTLRIENDANDTFFSLRIMALSPFSGESQVIESLQPYRDLSEIIFKITADQEQSGRTSVPFELRYQASIGTPFERVTFALDLDFGAHLIERDPAACAFDDAFD